MRREALGEQNGELFFAARQVMAGIFHFLAMLREASHISYFAASSLGKWSRFLMTLRAFIFSLSMALAVCMNPRI